MAGARWGRPRLSAPPPVQRTLDLDGVGFYLSRAAPSNNLHRYLPYESPEATWRDEAVQAEADFILLGHTHQQFVKPVGQKTSVNPGSLGQPKGAGPAACYAIWEDSGVEPKHIPYPYRETMAEIECPPGIGH